MDNTVLIEKTMAFVQQTLQNAEGDMIGGILTVYGIMQNVLPKLNRRMY